MRALLFDLDGVIYQGDSVIPGATDTLDWVSRNAIPHMFITNTTSKPRSAICAKLEAMGISVHPQQILSPPTVARHWLQSNPHGSVALFVPDQTRIEFEGLAIWDGDPAQSVGAVVVGDLGEEWSFARLNLAFRLLVTARVPRLIALGMTRYWRAPEGLRLDTGPFVAALQYASGVEPIVTGKPATTFFRTGAETLGVEPDQVMMIGDDIRGDVEGAQHAGLTGALVKTGKYRPEDLASGIKPLCVLGSIAELPGWWEGNA